MNRAQGPTSEAEQSTSIGSVRKRVESNETYVPPTNPYAKPEEEVREEEEVVSPTQAWLGDATLVDSDGETIGRAKLDQAEIIGVGLRCHRHPWIKYDGMQILACALLL